MSVWLNSTKKKQDSTKRSIKPNLYSINQIVRVCSNPKNAEIHNKSRRTHEKAFKQIVVDERLVQGAGKLVILDRYLSNETYLPPNEPYLLSKQPYLLSNSLK